MRAGGRGVLWGGTNGGNLPENYCYVSTRDSIYFFISFSFYLLHYHLTRILILVAKVVGGITQQRMPRLLVKFSTSVEDQISWELDINFKKSFTIV